MSVLKRRRISNESSISFINSDSISFNNDNVTTPMVFNPKKGDMVILDNFDNIIRIKDIMNHDKDITKSLITGYIVDLDGSTFSIKFEYKDIIQIIYVDTFINIYQPNIVINKKLPLIDNLINLKINSIIYILNLDNKIIKVKILQIIVNKKDVLLNKCIGSILNILDSGQRYNIYDNIYFKFNNIYSIIE